MEILYNPQFIKFPDPFKIKGGTRTIVGGFFITGFACIGIDGQVTVEGSDDGFSSTPFSQTVIGEDIVSVSPVKHDQWRMVADPGVTVGQLYIGGFVNIRTPRWPYKFEKDFISTDRKTLGGKEFSRQQYSKRIGKLSWNAIQEPELSIWRGWYNGTDGFRLPYIIREPDQNQVICVTSPGPFPLLFEGYNNHSGSVSMNEVLI